LERGWSQTELANRLQVSRQTIHAIESGKYDPSLPLAFAIGQLFGQLIEQVFTPALPGSSDPLSNGG
jgi:putative transcriptional regulator